jgi:uncharacterized protein (DUF4415 family)
MNVDEILPAAGKQEKRRVASDKNGGNSRSGIPEAKNPPGFRGSRKLYKPLKITVTFRLDADILAWLKKDGKGYQTRMNAVLRSAMEKAENAGRTGATKANYGR